MNAQSTPKRKITVQSSGSRARGELRVAGETREAKVVSPERSFSYSSY
ncbi:hypothetical protein [Nocardioides zeae]|uniref:Uncharacterized protein n=1 Tax=Nocardioides zeae TaxID=1457234 RepID=A0A6P0HHT7_9ACTN|nr:hypothetical protein [Nocardioides zeae]NEN77814.1 hypothetical protein [Nocardioides zeae]